MEVPYYTDSNGTIQIDVKDIVSHCPFADKSECSYYSQGLCGKCTYND